MTIPVRCGRQLSSAWVWIATAAFTMLASCDSTPVPGPDAASCIVASPRESIQECVETLADIGGGTVIVRAGNYSLTDHVHIASSNITIRGEGAATRISLADNVNRSAFLVGPVAAVPTGPRVENIVIEDLYVDGNKENQSSELYTDPGFEHIRVNCSTVRYARNVRIENATTSRCRSGGIVTTDNVSYFVARGVVARENYFDGIAMYLTEHSLVQGCLLEANSAAGLSVDLDFRNTIIADNAIVGNGHGEDGTSRNPGLYMGDASSNLIAGNIISGSAGNGVLVTDNPDSPGSCTGNVFSGNRIQQSGEFGIWIAQATCTGNVGHGTCYGGNVLGNVLEAVPNLYGDIDVLCQ